MWEIQPIKYDPSAKEIDHIKYGVLPKGFKETEKPKSLQWNKEYRVMARIIYKYNEAISYCSGVFILVNE